MQKKENKTKIFLIAIIAIIAVVLLINSYKNNLTGEAVKTEIPVEIVGESVYMENVLGSSFVESFNDNYGVLKTGQGLTIQTSLTASEDDYQTDVVLEADKDSIKYYLNLLEEYIESNTAYNFLGNNFRIIEVYDYGMVIERNGDLETVMDGDAFIGENQEDPNWVWDLNGLDTYSPSIAVENDFVYNDDSDNPPKVGECIYLPNNYAKICLDGLNVNDNEYTTYTIELDESADLSEVGGNSSEKTIYIHTIDRIIPIKDTSTNEIWVTGNGRVYYLNNNKINFASTIGSMNLRINNDLWLNIIKGGNTINVKLAPTYPLEETLTASFSVVNGKIFALGNTKYYEEANELTWGIQGVGSLNIGTKDEDHRTAYGIIIRDPKSHGASDEVVLEIPPEQVKAGISMSFAGEISVPPIQECTDSDDGLNYDVKGICTDSSGKTPWEDSCTIDTHNNLKLEEVYCDDDNFCYGRMVDCPNGCEDGVCIELKPEQPTKKINYQGVLEMLERCEVEDIDEGMTCAESARSDGAVALNTYLAILYHFPDGRKDTFVVTWLESDDIINKGDVYDWLNLVAGSTAVLDSYEIGCYTCYPESSVWRAGKAAFKQKTFFNR